MIDGFSQHLLILLKMLTLKLFLLNRIFLIQNFKFTMLFKNNVPVDKYIKFKFKKLREKTKYEQFLYFHYKLKTVYNQNDKNLTLLKIL